MRGGGTTSIREFSSSSESPNDSTRRTGSAKSTPNGDPLTDATEAEAEADTVDEVAGLARASSVHDLKPGLGLDWNTIDAAAAATVVRVAVVFVDERSAAVAVDEAGGEAVAASVASAGFTGAGGGMVALSCVGGVVVVSVLLSGCAAAEGAMTVAVWESAGGSVLAASCALTAAEDGCSPSESSSLISAHR